MFHVLDLFSELALSYKIVNGGQGESLVPPYTRGSVAFAILRRGEQFSSDRIARYRPGGGNGHKHDASQVGFFTETCLATPSFAFSTVIMTKCVKL